MCINCYVLFIVLYTHTYIHIHYKFQVFTLLMYLLSLIGLLCNICSRRNLYYALFPVFLFPPQYSSIPPKSRASPVASGKHCQNESVNFLAFEIEKGYGKIHDP